MSGTTGPDLHLDAISKARDAIEKRLAGVWPPTRESAGEQEAPAPVTGIVLGSGLGSLAEKIESPTEIPFGDIPGFAKSTASGHRGQLIAGTMEGSPVVAMAGRLHRYEGWSNAQVAFPIHVMHAIGATRLITSNAAGGVSPKLRVGDIVVIRDHIDWLHEPVNKRDVQGTDEVPLPGHFPGNQRQVYSEQLAQTALSASRRHGFTAIQGTYLATLGPTYETRGEYRMMRQIGVDVVGMSTVPEVLAAAVNSMPVLALSIVSNVANPDQAIVADHEEVLQAGDAAAAKLEAIVRSVLANV